MVRVGLAVPEGLAVPKGLVLRVGLVDLEAPGTPGWLAQLLVTLFLYACLSFPSPDSSIAQWDSGKVRLVS